MIPRHRQVVMAAAALLGCAKSPGPSVPAVDIPWTPFYWVSARTDSLEFDFTGILLHLQLRQSGPRSLLQMDLAGSGNMPNGFPRFARELGPPPRVRPGELYGLLGPAIPRRLVGAPDSLRDHWREGEVGTWGLPNYLSNTLLLDFPNRRLATLPQSVDWAPLLGPSAVIAPLEKGQLDQVVIPVGMSTGRVLRGILDSGLSPFPLWTTREVWQDLTGLGGAGPGTRIYRIPNRGGAMVFVGAPLRVPLGIGAWSLRIPEVVYLAQGPAGAALEEWRPQVDLVLGPAAFARNTVLAIDLAHSRLGLARRIVP